VSRSADERPGETYDRAVAGPESEHAQGDPTIRVFIVDDHGMVRRGMRSYLSIFDDIEVVGEAANGRDALDRLRALAAGGESPDVVLMDLAMEPVDGVTATREVRSAMPEVEVVAVTSLIDQSRVDAALQAGASGYLVKDAAPEELALAIRAAHRGEVHLDSALARRLMDSLRPASQAAPGAFDELSDRELEIMRLIAEGHANKEIALRLVISERTARTHVSHILRKLGLSSRTQAALLAVREGLPAPATSRAGRGGGP
jgi:DNA-binding NarL/FixJ family response regulator